MIWDIVRYSMGEKVDFLKYKPDLSNLTKFEQAVLFETRKIPYGTTITYSELADRIGSSEGAQAVGQALSKNPYPIVIPCHRVIAKYGIGGYSGGIGLKKRLLEIEANMNGKRKIQVRKKQDPVIICLTTPETAR